MDTNGALSFFLALNSLFPLEQDTQDIGFGIKINSTILKIFFCVLIATSLIFSILGALYCCGFCRNCCTRHRYQEIGRIDTPETQRLIHEQYVQQRRYNRQFYDE